MKTLLTKEDIKHAADLIIETAERIIPTKLEKKKRKRFFRGERK